MSVSKVQSDILSVLIESKTYISLRNIITKIKHHKITPRAFQIQMKQLIECDRVSTRGSASSIEYIIEDIQRNYPTSQFLYVFKGGLIIGQLFKVKNIYRFYYSSEYLAKYNEEIPTLPLSIEPIDFSDEIPAVFEDNLPEGKNRELLEVTHKVADEFEILNLMNDNIGDLCFSKSKEKCDIAGQEATRYLSSLNEILGTHQKINHLENFKIDATEEELFPENIDISKIKPVQAEGISGFQYKKFVNINFLKKEITIDDNAHQYILKPYQKEKIRPESEFYFPHSALNEHLHLSFAKNTLGLRVPYSAIVSTENSQEFHYIVKRFDRKGANRFAKATFSVFLGLRSDQKYDTTSEKMFTRIAKELISPHERRELLKHYLYSVIIVYEDLHTKNLSLIFDQGKVLFAPLYDVCCTGLYDFTKGYESHLTINGKRFKIRPNDFKPLCKALKIDFKEFKAIAQEMAISYMKEMPLYFEEIEKLGSLLFTRKKYKTMRGSREPKYIIDQTVEFVEVLRSFHAKRVKELQELGWIEKEN